VGFFQALGDSGPISDNIHRIYAVTMKNLPIMIGFAIITTSQFVLGTCFLAIVAKKKGRGKLITWKSHVSSRALMRLTAVARL